MAMMMILRLFRDEPGLFAAAIILISLYFWLTRRPRDATKFSRSLKERDAVRSRMGQAAQTRQSQKEEPTRGTKQENTQQDEPIQSGGNENGTVGTEEKPTCPTFAESCSQATSPSKMKRSPKRTPTEDETVNRPMESKSSQGIRKATYIDNIKWKEERLAMETFGFDIYGNNSTPCLCCAKPTKNISTSNFGSGIHHVASISYFVSADEALKLLQQLQTEFEPVARNRGWKVWQLTEMCCCGDGDETLSFQTSKTQPSNVLGYCVSSNDNRAAQAIHIRLRKSCGGPFFNYHELVETMAHELAHIAIGPHNEAFFKLMQDLLNERLQIAAQDNTAFPLTSGRRLGGGNYEVLGSRELRQRVAQAAKAREKRKA